MEDAEDIKRPKLLWVNLALTVALMTALIIGVLPMPVLFMVGFAIALVINYPNLAEQRRRVVNHAGNVLSVVSRSSPQAFHRHPQQHRHGRSDVAQLPGRDSGIVGPVPGGDHGGGVDAVHLLHVQRRVLLRRAANPVRVAGNYGITPVEMARASLAGQPVHLLSPLVPSTYLLVGLARSNSPTTRSSP